jgi:hypothetical protein
MFLGVDPGESIDEAWWDEMLVSWFDVPEEETPVAADSTESNEQENLEDAKRSL